MPSLPNSESSPHCHALSPPPWPSPSIPRCRSRTPAALLKPPHCSPPHSPPPSLSPAAAQRSNPPPLPLPSCPSITAAAGLVRWSKPPPGSYPPPCTPAVPADRLDPAAHRLLPPSSSPAPPPSSPAPAPSRSPPGHPPSLPTHRADSAPAGWLAHSAPHSSTLLHHTPPLPPPASFLPALRKVHAPMPQTELPSPSGSTPPPPGAAPPPPEPATHTPLSAALSPALPPAIPGLCACTHTHASAQSWPAPVRSGKIRHLHRQLRGLTDNWCAPRRAAPQFLATPQKQHWVCPGYDGNSPEH